MSRFVAACRAEEVAPGRGKTVEVDGLAVAVFNDDGAYHALLDRCPHAGGSLGGGWIEGGEAVCPLHRWRFRLASGLCAAGGGPGVHRFRCEVRDGIVRVEI